MQVLPRWGESLRSLRREAASPSQIIVALGFAYVLVPIIAVEVGRKFFSVSLLVLSGSLQGYRSILSSGLVTILALAVEVTLGSAVLLVLLGARGRQIISTQFETSAKYSIYLLASVDFIAPILANTFVAIVLFGTPVPVLSSNLSTLNVGKQVTMTAIAYNEPVGASVHFNAPVGLHGSFPHCESLGRRMKCTAHFTSNIPGVFVFTAVSQLSANLVPNHNLADPFSSSPGQWTSVAFGGSTLIPIGKQMGDFSVNKGALTYLGTGKRSPNGFLESQVISVTSGATYTVSANVDARNVIPESGPRASEGYSPAIAVLDPQDLGIVYAEPEQLPGTDGQVSQTFTVPTGVSELVVAYYVKEAIVARGMPLTFSNIELFRTSPSPLNFNSTTVRWQG